jgi:type VI secretion system secreted protein Hcp
MIFFGACPGRAAVDAYLKIEGVDGDSTDSQHPKWIQVLSFSHAVSAPSAAASLPSLSEICFLKLTDQASPVLEQDCAKGKSFPAATLELITVDAARARFYQIVLSNLVVSSVSASGSAGDLKPAESICLAFSLIQWSYTEFDATGLPRSNIKAWWDIALNLGGNNVAPVLRVTGTQVGAGSLQLAWPGQAGKTYNILASSLVTGPFQFAQSVAASADGPISLPLPTSGQRRFFIVEESP